MNGNLMKRLTDERFASIPAMIEQGFSKAEIAAMWGVKISTLQVQCSRRGVSLRKGGHLLPRRQLSLPDAPLTLTNTALMACGRPREPWAWTRLDWPAIC